MSRKTPCFGNRAAHDVEIGGQTDVIVEYGPPAIFAETKGSRTKEFLTKTP